MAVGPRAGIGILPLLALLLLILLGSAYNSAANGDEYGEEEYDDAGEGELAESLGEAAWNLGPILVIAFLIYKYTLPYQVRMGIRLPLSFRHVLDLHIYSSIVLGLMALAHGFMLIERARLLEYVIGVVIVVMLVTGALLRWSRDRRVKMFARLIHAQRILALALLVLVAIHTATMED